MEHFEHTGSAEKLQKCPRLDISGDIQDWT